MPTVFWSRLASTLDFRASSQVRLQSASDKFREAEVNNTTDLRRRDLESALRGFLHHPLFGVGIGAYNNTNEKAPHNAYVRFLSETGVFGFVGFAGYLCAISARIFRRSRAAGSKEDGWIVTGLQALFATHLAYLFLGDWPFQMYFWLFAGLAAAAAEGPEVADRPTALTETFPLTNALTKEGA
jgi:O-antigen ligase